MLKLQLTKKFRKDLERARKRGYKMKKLDKVVLALANQEVLPAKYRDHALMDSREYQDTRECHIEPDWLLVYRVDGEALTLILLRTGTHSDLF